MSTGLLGRVKRLEGGRAGGRCWNCWRWPRAAEGCVPGCPVCGFEPDRLEVEEILVDSAGRPVPVETFPADGRGDAAG